MRLCKPSRYVLYTNLRVFIYRTGIVVTITHRSLVECGHTFCQDCLFKLFAKAYTCPICRTPIKSKPVVVDYLQKAVQEIGHIEGDVDTETAPVQSWDAFF